MLRTKKKDRFSVVESLYRDIDLNFVGPKCSEAGITCSILKDILFEISDENINEGSNTPS